MRRLPILLLVLVTAAGALATQALARSGTHGAQKRVIMTAAGVSANAPIGCFRVFVSTVNPTWAATTYGGSSARPCVTYAADGVSITHHVHGRWRFVSAGSAFSCPIPGHLPAAVQRDLRLFCHRG